MLYTHHSEQWLPYPLEAVFAFFTNPENLPRLMPPWQQARIEQAFLTPPPSPPSPTGTHIVAGIGSRITLSLKPFPYFPLRLSWEAEISSFIWNQYFCDTQLRGPFSSWHHCHTVTSHNRLSEAGIATPGTLLRDEVAYEIPLGKLGSMAQHLFIARQLRSTFAYRHARTLQLLLP